MFQTGKKNVQRKSGMTTEQFFFFFLSCILSSFCWTSQKGKIFYFLSVAVRLPISFFFWVYNQKVVHTVHIRARLLLEINMDDNLKKVNYIWGFIFINDLSINRVVVDN